jgi:hypothetical protein
VRGLQKVMLPRLRHLPQQQQQQHGLVGMMQGRKVRTWLWTAQQRQQQ